MVDRSISCNSDFARVMSLGEGHDPHTGTPMVSGTHSSGSVSQMWPHSRDASGSELTAGAPFTAAVAATVSSVRELCGQRVPRIQWQQWMDSMYGEALPPLPMEVSVMCTVCVVVAERDILCAAMGIDSDR